MYGADSHELRRIATEFARTADEIDSQAATLSRFLRTIEWIGGFASAFLGDWVGQLAPSLGLSTGFLRDASRELIRQADEQDRASESGGERRYRPRPPGGRRIAEPPPTERPNNFLFFHWGEWSRREYSDTPLFAGEPGREIAPADVVQGTIGDCYLVAAFAAIAASPSGRQRLREMITENEDGTFTVEFADGERVTVDDTFYQSGDEAMYAKIGDDLWSAVLEEAYAKKHGGFDKIVGGRAADALTELGFASRTESPAALGLDRLKEIVHGDKPVVFSASLNQAEGGITSNYSPDDRHAFSLVDSSVDEQGQTWITVRNPWGSNEALGMPPGAIAVAGSGNVRMPLEVAQRMFYAVSVPN